jgi:hypothetical protein
MNNMSLALTFFINKETSSPIDNIEEEELGDSSRSGQSRFTFVSDIGVYNGSKV